MIRRPERLHKRRTPSIFPADAPTADRARRHSEPLRPLAARLHRAARARAQAAGQAAGLPPRTALVLSTGVIGVPLPLEQVADGLRAAAGRLTPEGGPEAARAIMTTDTRPKHCAVRFETPAGIVTVGGIAKGAGMIHPDMATLLAVLTTDAVGEPAGLQPLLRRVADRSFNAISVDGDTST